MQKERSEFGILEKRIQELKMEMDYSRQNIRDK
jgi:hypothetical protein